MKIIDANIVLRYLLKDNEDQFLMAEAIIENEEVFVPNEIVAEIVYVLEKVYKIKRREIKESLIILLDYNNITLTDKHVINESLLVYDKYNLDFADSLLAAYNSINGDTIYTFDQKLNRVLNKI